MKRLLSAFLILLLSAATAFGTVSDSTSRVTYNANGSTVDFAFTFGVGATSEIDVVLTTSAGVETTLTETTHYSVACTNDDCESGGTVTTVATYASGNTITIIRDVPITQETDYTENMPTLYETFEDALDKGIRIDQQQQEEIDRSFKMKRSYSPTTYSVEIAPEAGKLIGWNSGGTALTSYASSQVYVETFKILYDDYGNSLATAYTDIGSDNVTVLIDRDTTVSADLTLGANIELQFINGAQITVASTKTLTLYSPANIKAQPNQQIFTVAGTVAFTEAGEVSSLWFAADEWDSFRAGIAALAAGKGGTLLVQPAIYDADTECAITSNYAIHIKGNFGRAYQSGSTLYDYYIRPRTGISGSIINYTGNGGGIIQGLTFIDDSDVSNATWESRRVVAIDSAITFTNNPFGVIRDCHFRYLKGSAFQGIVSTGGRLEDSVIYYCGDTGYPAINLAPTVASRIAAFKIDKVIMDGCFNDDYLATNSNTARVVVTNSTFEAIAHADPATDPTNQTYIDADSPNFSIDNCTFNKNYAEKVNLSGLQSTISNSQFLGNNTLGAINISGASSQINNVTIRLATSNVGSQVTVSGDYAEINNLYMQRGGNLVLSGVYPRVNNLHVYDPDTTETYAVNSSGDRAVINNFLISTTAGTTGGLSVSGATSKITNGDIATIAGIGIALTSTSDASSLAHIYINGATGDGIDIETGGNSSSLSHLQFASITGQAIDDNATGTMIDAQTCFGINETLTSGVSTLQTFGVSYLNSAAGAITGTLPDGQFSGQRKIIQMINGSNSSTVTITHHETSDPEIFTFAQTTDILILEWNGLEWVTINNQGVGV